MSASEGGNFDMARSISRAHNISATSSANTSSEGDFRNLKALLETRSHSAFIFGRLTSSLVRGTAIELATGRAQLTTESAIAAVDRHSINDKGCQQSWQHISQSLATTEATSASVATQPFLSKLFVATLATASATAFATASVALVGVSIMQLAILSRLRQQRRSLSLWPHHNGFYVKPLTSAANSALLASILAGKISVTYLRRLPIDLRNIICINICGKQTFSNNQNQDFSEYRFRGSVGINSIRGTSFRTSRFSSVQFKIGLFLAEGFFKLFSTK